jgi:hypothetical protein
MIINVPIGTQIPVTIHPEKDGAFFIPDADSLEAAVVTGTWSTDADPDNPSDRIILIAAAVSEIGTGQIFCTVDFGAGSVPVTQDVTVVSYNPAGAASIGATPEVSEPFVP